MPTPQSPPDQPRPQGAEDARSREARETLERVHRDSETLGGSTMARAAGDKAQGWLDHFTAKDTRHDPSALGDDGRPDATELWGRRIGRTLSLIGVVVLAYMLGQQLRMW